MKYTVTIPCITGPPWYWMAVVSAGLQSYAETPDPGLPATGVNICARLGDAFNAAIASTATKTRVLPWPNVVRDMESSPVDPARSATSVPR